MGRLAQSATRRRPPLLFDVTEPNGETSARDLAASKPEIAARLQKHLAAWAAELLPPGLAPTAAGPGRHRENLFREHGLTTGKAK